MIYNREADGGKYTSSFFFIPRFFREKTWSECKQFVTSYPPKSSYNQVTNNIQQESNVRQGPGNFLVKPSTIRKVWCIYKGVREPKKQRDSE
ncbi:hypothetical protein AA984_07820 [Brevibacillus formosus]|uniref:Uncharacterized protein n=1 Tax=Brevibacillus formosus TaxID=54913 RepID=A0A837KUX7_9BACL|nr:hypothetical protein AA984_07820 [Brevibacillus formosus]PSJ96084.1 hypothetical protein C7R91_15400 [Brevibacillus formosus]GED56449.1 hypothetical protein BFO01nite_05810 [Brevibacillus formosus]